jgi:hypothetical protein
MLVFFLQGPLEQIAPGKLPMAAWDVVACLVGIALFGYAVWSMESNRRRNEQRQKVFAASLRQEIELGIAQVDFDMARVAGDREWRVGTACVVAALILAWEMGRLNGHPLPWKTLWMVFPWLFMVIWMRRSIKQRIVDRISKRRQALEALRAKLDESSAE